jgi:DNA polymerase
MASLDEDQRRRLREEAAALLRAVRGHLEVTADPFVPAPPPPPAAPARRPAAASTATPPAAVRPPAPSPTPSPVPSPVPAAAPVPTPAPVPAAAPAPPVTVRAGLQLGPLPAGQAAPSLSQRHSAMQAVRTDLGDCQRCKLCKGRTNIVFGVGSPAAELVFVGEGPGRDEDLSGEPFVGLAGQMLTRIIENVFKLRRDDVYICNVVKCRPPQNRNPEPDEIAACQPFLIRQLEVLRPRIIVCLGKFAAQTLLGTEASISSLRGRFHDYHGIRVMPTYHPAFLLRNPAMKRTVWEDMKLVVAELARPPAP